MNDPQTPPDVPTASHVTHVRHWIIPPAYATRFVTDMDGRLIIEFSPGREQEIRDYLVQHIDANLSHQQTIDRAQVERRKREAEIRAAMERKERAVKPAAPPAHVPIAPVPNVAPAPDNKEDAHVQANFDSFSSDEVGEE